MSNFRIIIGIDIEADNLDDAYRKLRAGMAETPSLTNAWESVEAFPEDGDAFPDLDFEAAIDRVIEEESNG